MQFFEYPQRSFLPSHSKNIWFRMVDYPVLVQLDFDEFY